MGPVHCRSEDDIKVPSHVVPLKKRKKRQSQTFSLDVAEMKPLSMPYYSIVHQSTRLEKKYDIRPWAHFQFPCYGIVQGLRKGLTTRAGLNNIVCILSKNSW